ncbi:DUF4046 domain-containing protein [Paenibacillus polymyxa]|uniref:DUF4046 domain-containing protein n=1 Tax=Paenibacillus polymyxa TaxID=1406 RepID=A0ABX2ZDJ9_PAEPO|nr:DUF4046 domain-containing protein [Paenibacillus polymyxa]ODA08265.1 hypothetical protein A7312_27755 [Paenibacillus polymyxa]
MVENVTRDIITTYQEVLNGKIKRFPDGTWSDDKTGVYFYKRCLRFAVECIYGWDKEMTLEKITAKWFGKVKLATGFGKYFERSPYLALKETFPEWNFHPWEMKTSPNGCWDNETIKKAVRWVFNDKLKWGRSEITNNISKDFNEYGFKKMYAAFHQGAYGELIDRDSSGLYELLSYCFEEYDFKIWEFKKLPTWTESDMKESFKWLIEERLNWDYEKTLDNLKYTHFRESGLGNILANYFNSSPYKAMRFTYPDKDWSKLRHRAELE